VREHPTPIGGTKALAGALRAAIALDTKQLARELTRMVEAYLGVV